MSFADDRRAKLEAAMAEAAPAEASRGVASRGPGRPAAKQSGPARPAPKYDPDKMYLVTKQDSDGGHQGPVPLTVVGDRGTEHAVLLPGRPVLVSGNLLNESLERAVVDERGPDADANQHALSRQDVTIGHEVGADGVVHTTSKHQIGAVRKRFHVEVEEA